MVEQVQKWKSAVGYHDTREQAEAAELETTRLRAVLSLIDDGKYSLIRFASTGQCADWIVRNRDELLKALR